MMNFSINSWTSLCRACLTVFILFAVGVRVYQNSQMLDKLDYIIELEEQMAQQGPTAIVSSSNKNKSLLRGATTEVNNSSGIVPPTAVNEESSLSIVDNQDVIQSALAEEALVNNTAKGQAVVVAVPPEKQEARQQQAGTLFDIVISNNTQVDDAGGEEEDEASTVDDVLSLAQVIVAPSNFSSSNNNNNNMILERMTAFNSSRVPDWMNDYFAWHRQYKQSLNETNWKEGERRYLVMRCTRKDMKCGGTSDRLKPLPVFLRIAKETNRLLLIYWNRPCRLEEFLRPRDPQNIIDWTVPNWMVPHIENNNPKDFTENGKKLQALPYNTRLRIVEARLQKDDGGQAILEKLVKAADAGEQSGTGSGRTNVTYSDPKQYEYVQFYHDMFRMMFQPSHGVAKIVEEQMVKSGLVPGEYIVAHYRAYYAIKKEQADPQKIAKRAVNAVNCASQLMTNNRTTMMSSDSTASHTGSRNHTKIYFASDSSLAIDRAQEYASSTAGNRLEVVRNTRNLNTEPLHLDFASRGNQTYPVKDYYDSFVDLWLMGSGRCVTYGVGGFGRFARMLSYDYTCFNAHFGYKKMNSCEFASPSPDLPTLAAQ